MSRGESVDRAIEAFGGREGKGSEEVRFQWGSVALVRLTRVGQYEGQCK